MARVAEVASTPVQNVVELVIPVRADLMVLARLTAATVASRGGFDVEEIDDLRLAVDELCLLIVDDGADGRLQLAFTGEDDSVEIACVLIPGDTTYDSRSGGGGVDRVDNHHAEGLSDRILDALVDEHGVDVVNGQPVQAWLRKRRRRAAE